MECILHGAIKVFIEDSSLSSLFLSESHHLRLASHFIFRRLHLRSKTFLAETLNWLKDVIVSHEIAPKGTARNNSTSTVITCTI